MKWQNVRGIVLRSVQEDPDLHRALAAFYTKGAPWTEGLLAEPQQTRDGGMMCKQAAERPRDNRRDSRGERSPFIPFETRPDSPCESGMQRVSRP